jgi:hypothetical protein
MLSSSPSLLRFCALLAAATPGLLFAQGPIPPPAGSAAPVVPTVPAPAAPTGPITLSPAQAEAQKCEEKIASVQRDVLGKYDDQLAELQLTLQKAADLEGALAARAERLRLKTDQMLSEKDYVSEPKSLRAVQVATVTKLRELVSALVQEAVPRLIEFKKQLTVSGKLDEAVGVREAIERLQNAHVPITRANSSTVIPAETLILAYAGDRARADKTYKGQKIVVRGILGGYRPDPTEARNYQLFLTGSTGSGWVQCTLPYTDFRFREDKSSFGVLTFVITTKDGEGTARLQKGQAVELRGVCGGLDEIVRLDRCELPK